MQFLKGIWALSYKSTASQSLKPDIIHFKSMDRLIYERIAQQLGVCPVLASHTIIFRGVVFHLLPKTKSKTKIVGLKIMLCTIEICHFLHTFLPVPTCKSALVGVVLRDVKNFQSLIQVYLQVPCVVLLNIPDEVCVSHTKHVGENKSWVRRRAAHYFNLQKFCSSTRRSHMANNSKQQHWTQASTTEQR